MSGSGICGKNLGYVDPAATLSEHVGTPGLFIPRLYNPPSAGTPHSWNFAAVSPAWNASHGSQVPNLVTGFDTTT